MCAHTTCPPQPTERYDFSLDKSHTEFAELFCLLVEQRFLLKSEQQPPRDRQLRVLQCMRVLMRDAVHRTLFCELGGAEALVKLFISLADEHFTNPHGNFTSEMLVETLSILKRFASLDALAPKPMPGCDHLRLQRSLAVLLSTRDALVLQCVLVAIHQFVQLECHLKAIGQLGCAEILLRILMDYESSFKQIAAELIELLLCERTFLQDTILHDGTAAILSMLHTEDVNLQMPLLRILQRLTEFANCVKEIRQVGGINVLLAVLSTPVAPQVAAAICTVLTTMALDDETALQIRKANGVYLLGLLLLQNTAHRANATPNSASSAEANASSDDVPTVGPAAQEISCTAPNDSEPSQELLAAHVFRALRFVFSTERNRKLFQRLFPPDLFAAFIDLGHYVRQLETYLPLANQFSQLSSEAKGKMQEAFSDINMVKGPSQHRVKDYVVQEMLGKGAFGCVYQVKKDTGETLFAMKELPTGALASAETSQTDSCDTSTHLNREVKILSTLQHPNIIRYYESFQLGQSHYIVMELVEGATLLDHLNSLTEKCERMPETRIWSIFTQMCLALRYLHKEKHVVHRDLTPANVMINGDGVVKMADFGLAKQRVSTSSVMESVVGTVLYQCPEIIMHEAYGEKADIWSLGCILYQTAMLRPPFEGSNPLVVAQTIVEGKYAPITGPYAPLLIEVVSKLLCVEPEERPDIDAISSLISPVLMAELARVSRAEHKLRAEVHIERDFRQRHEREASRNKEAVHRLFARHRLGPREHRAPSIHRESVDPLRRTAQSRSPMLSISPSRIREIHDPCSRLLNQLHKILFICQLPPSIEGELSTERLVIEKYKRELFSHRNHYRGRNLKDELHKVVTGSQETIDVAFRSNAAEIDGQDGFAVTQRISYEEMQRYIEQVLAVTGYYALNTSVSEGSESCMMDRGASSRAHIIAAA